MDNMSKLEDTQLYYFHYIGHQRLGQSWMNALSDVDPELYKEISQTESDCFHDDSKIDKFMEVVKERWRLGALK